MQNVYVGRSWQNKPTKKLKHYYVQDFKDFCHQFLSRCSQSDEKAGYYITIGSHYIDLNRSNKSQREAWLLPIDGDSTVRNKDSCIPPEEIHKTLKNLKLNHFIYTTYSNGLNQHKWRAFIPCYISGKNCYAPTVNALKTWVLRSGAPDLIFKPENYTWSNPWFLPSRKDPNDGYFKTFSYFDGNDFKEILPEVSPPKKPEVIFDEDISDKQTIDNIINTIINGEADTGLHKSTRDLAWGLIRDGVSPTIVKSVLHGLMHSYDLSNERQKENYNKVHGVVDSAFKKKIEIEVVTSKDWEEDMEKEIISRVFTNYPNQGGMMEELVNCCMDFMLYPNKQIATVAAHSLVSSLGGRVYCTDLGLGIVWTCLITGRSTIGKSWIKKFCTHVLNSFSPQPCASHFLGSYYYTSVKNMVAELMKTGSILSIRTESGQTDKSNAGDMTRVMSAELEFATESGPLGFISSGGQNDKIPELYSPAVTTIRESVALIQSQADLDRLVVVSGLSGRRSHVLIDPIKSSYNYNQKFTLDESIKQLVSILFKLAKDERRRDVTIRMANNLWMICNFELDAREYLSNRIEIWKQRENEAALKELNFESTYYGRLIQKVQSWAARLAICDDPCNPLIKVHHLMTAEKSLKSEYDAFVYQEQSGNLDDPWSRLVCRIKMMFTGDLIKKYGKKYSSDLLHVGALKWADIQRNIANYEEYKILKRNPAFFRYLKEHLEAVNIVEMPPKEKQILRTTAKIFKRI